MCIRDRAQERFYTLNGAYSVSLASLDVSPEIQASTSDRGYYTLNLVPGGADNEQYTVRATATSQQSGDSDCAIFTLTHQGVKSATSDSCW